MDLERQALLDHAALCRHVAGEISHANAANRLMRMAQEYEARAFRLAGGHERRFRETDGIIWQMFNSEPTGRFADA